MQIRRIVIGNICELNSETIGSSNSPEIIRYLDTSSITKNKIECFQLLDSRQTLFPCRAKRKVKNGTIIYSTVRPNLEHFGYLVNPEDNLIVSTGFLTIDVIDKDIDSEFLYYAITQKHITDYLHTIAVNNVSSYPSINPSDIRNLEFKVPKDKAVQRRIASVLSSLDSKIDLNNRINVELEAMAKTLYDYWFVQFDFPDENGNPYKSSGGKMVWNEELKREIPGGWEVGTASDFFALNPGLSLKKGSLSSYIDMNALPTAGFMTKEVQLKEYNGGVKFQNDDLVIARITPCLENGKTGLITLLKENETGFGSTEFIVLRGRKMKLSSFAALLSRSELFRKYAIANMTGTSGRKRVDASALEIFPMAIPPEELLMKFEETVGTFFKKTTLNTTENQRLSNLRDWLLPMLMNGQVKVGEAIEQILNIAAEHV